MNETLSYIADKYRLSFDHVPIVINRYRRERNLRNLFAELGFNKGAEIGVDKGVYAEQLFERIPGLKLYCIDTWKVDPDYSDKWAQSQSELDNRFKEAKQRLQPYDCTIIKKSSVEAVKDFEPDSLDFVYIDANHEFSYVINDIIEWNKIVRPGGILAGHDYDSAEFGVGPAVRAYAEAYKINPWFVLHSSNVTDSWMWVKP